MSNAAAAAGSLSHRSGELAVVPDDLLSQVIGVGQVDLLIGVVTLAHADAVDELVRAAGACLGTFFPRLRAAILHLDRGSMDGTAGAARAAWDNEGRGRGARGLRTSHFIGTTIESASDGDAVRVLLAAADLLQARALVVLDADSESVSAGDVAALAGPVLEGAADVVAASYPREPATGLLVSQLVRPLTWATFNRRLAEPLLPTFACSGTFAAHATQRAWQTTATERLTRYWISATALSGGFDTRQCPLGSRRPRRAPLEEGLPAIFGRVASSVLSSLDAHADAWLAVADVADLPSVRGVLPPEGVPPTAAASRWRDGFVQDVQHLTEILTRILSAQTWTALQAASTDGVPTGFPDDLWTAVLADFLLSFHRRVMSRDHITQALLPLYRARSSAFVEAHGHATGAEAEEAIRDLGACVEAMRPRLVQQWANQDEVEHG